MGKVKVIRVVFSILLLQLLVLSVNADEKADYLKLAQRCGKKFGAVRLLTFRSARFQTSTRMLRPSFSLIIEN